MRQEAAGQRLKVCLARINYVLGNISRQVERLKELIQRYRQADLLVLPELILHGHPSLQRPEGMLYRRMKVAYREISQDVREHAHRQGARVIIGELKRRGLEFQNLATYIDAQGAQSYVKTHVHWTENFIPG